MSRKRNFSTRKVHSDAKFNDLVVTKFVNAIMKNGERAIAEGIFYGSLNLVKEKVGEDGMKVFKKALENVKPMLEVKSRRIGGATYQVPVEVRPERRQSLASRWIIDAARARSENSMTERLAAEISEASNGQGSAMKKRDDVHKMAEANRAFAHFRW